VTVREDSGKGIGEDDVPKGAEGEVILWVV